MIITDAVPFGVKIQIRAKNKPRRKPRKPPVWQYPFNAERKYRAQLVGYVEAMERAIRQTIYPHLESIVASRNETIPIDRADDYAAEIDRLMRATTLSVSRIPFNKEQVARETGHTINTFNSKQWDKQLKVSLGVDVFRREEYVPSTINSYVKENVSLITKMENDLLSQVEETIQRNVRQGATAPRIAREIEGRTGVAKSRARLIARDQTGKLNGQLTQLRQEDIGIDSYTWRTSEDERVRSTHRAHDDKKYKWNSPPSGTGHPGQDYQCRCYAEPDFERLLEDIPETPAPPPPPTPRATPAPRRRRAKPKAEPLPDVQVGKFVVAKSIREAEEWARKNDIADFINYKGLDLDTINEINASVFEALKEFPGIREQFQFVGSFAGRRKEIFDANIEDFRERYKNFGVAFGWSDAKIESEAKKALRRKIGRDSKSWYAYAVKAGKLKGGGGIAVNQIRDFQKIKTSMMRDSKIGFHPPNIPDQNLVKSVFDHEVGHVIDNHLKLTDGTADIRDLYNQTGYDGVKKGLSEYALKNVAEFIAEGYAEYKNAPKPRKLAKEIGKIINTKRGEN